MSNTLADIARRLTTEMQTADEAARTLARQSLRSGRRPVPYASARRLVDLLAQLKPKEAR